jgi:diguanylate cyclase (GGDEF)-like protein
MEAVRFLAAPGTSNRATEEQVISMEPIVNLSSRQKARKKKESPPHTSGRKLDLTTARRILRHAGRPEPAQLSDNSDVQLQAVIDALCDLSIHDGLTGLVNATFFHALLTREIDRSSRTGRTCGLMVIDIDHFKTVNDTYGHQAGDTALQFLSQRLKKALRSMDTAARIGGEEFAVIVPECTPQDAVHVAKRLHALFHPLRVALGENTIQFTVSMGLVWTNPKVIQESAALLAQADQEMYRAKREGRGRLCYPPLFSTQISTEERASLTSMRLEEEPNAG